MDKLLRKYDLVCNALVGPGPEECPEESQEWHDRVNKFIPAFMIPATIVFAILLKMRWF